MKKHTTVVGRSLTGGILFFLALFFLPDIVFAAEVMPTGAFVVHPAKIELSIAPGEEKTTTITLSNGTALPLSVSVSYEDVAPNAQTSASDEPVTLLGVNGGAYPLRDLFQTKNKSIELLSGEEVQIPISIHIPKDAEAGGRYGSAIFTFKPILAKGVAPNTNVAVESRVATLFYVRVLGGAKEEGHLVTFGLFNKAQTSRSPTEEMPLRFQVTYENTGSVHVNPYGQLTVSSFYGSPKVIIIPPQAVLPGGTRLTEVDLRDPLSIGYYTAHLELNRGYQDIVDEADVTFWVVPGPEGSILLAALLVFFIWLIRRSLQLSKHRIS